MSETNDTTSVEFAEWRTPFENGCVTILDVSYCNGAEEDTPVELADGRCYRFGSMLQALHDGKQLLIRLFNNDDETVYRVSFQYAGAFRVLDEHGLLELWGASNHPMPRPAHSTFRVRNHGWSKESLLSFHMCTTDGWSYVIATHAECVEILSRSEPQVVVERKVAASRLQSPVEQA